MLKPKVFANAATVIIAVFYVVCALISYVAPDLLIAIANSWIHILSLESLKATSSMSTGSLITGLMTISVLTWITTYLFAKLYNKLAK